MNGKGFVIQEPVILEEAEKTKRSVSNPSPHGVGCETDLIFIPDPG